MRNPKTENTSPEKSSTKKFYKKTFENIPEIKQNRIISAAIDEFASKGYNAANINVIAESAEVSIGSMYTYFPSKEDLFLLIIDNSYRKIEEALEQIPQSGSVFEKIEKLLRLAQHYAHEHQKLNQLYLDITSESLSSLSRKLSRKLETITSNMYREAIAEGKRNGEVDLDIDDNIIAFCVDNLAMMLQFSYTSEYYKERMKIFVGKNALKDDEFVIREVMKLLKKAIASPTEKPTK